MVYSIIQKSQLEGSKRLDAEYYQPEYLELIKKINNSKNGFNTFKKIDCKIVSGPFGSSLKSDNYLKSGVPFIRINDLQNFFIDDAKLVYISAKNNERLKQSQLFPFDLVLSKVGNTIGIISIVPEEFSVCNISENNIGIKFENKQLSKEYKYFILTFLNSRFGFKQIFRRISGNAQPKLNLKDVEEMIFAVPDETILSTLGNLIAQATNETRESKNLYSKAESLLLKELDLEKFGGQGDSLFTIINLSEAKSVARLDAEYFNSDVNKLIDKIKKISKPLGELVSIKKGIEPGAEEYLETGKQFIRVSSLSKYGIDDSDQKCLSEELFQKLKDDFQPKKGEILLTKDASPGVTYVLKEDIDGIVSGGILRLKIKDKLIEDEYLALCLNSIVGQMQAERDAGGSVIKHWKPEQIKQVMIPILAKPIQEKISSLIRESFIARRKAKELLDGAKRKVEEMIENN